MTEAEKLAAKKSYDINDLLAIMRILRAEGGCPWDREQTHSSIRSSMLEEAYEAAEAIDADDREMLLEELGDVLLQVVFHARIEEEKGSFNFDSVADGICRKMIERHPHVFGEIKVDGVGDVLTNWDAIKQRSHGRSTVTEALDGVSKALPALMRAQKLYSKASKAGYVCENRTADALKDSGIITESMSEADFGELLFAVASLAKSAGVDAEQALIRKNDSFIAEIAEKESGNND